MSVIVISGAGSGIGRAIVKDLSHGNKGRKFVLLGRNKDKLLQTASECKIENRSWIFDSDTTDAHRIRELIYQNKLEEEEYEGIIANAGIIKKNNYNEDDIFEEVIRTNLKGPYILVNEFLPLLKNSSEGYRSIVLISSVLNRLGVSQISAYSASKSGQIGLMRSWANELAQYNILVNAVSPGWVETRMAINTLEEIAENQGLEYNQIKDQVLREQMMHKMALPEEVAALVSFLFSKKQRSITGQNLHINNGAFMS
ncbi:SDR family oxidoreductase [Bacteriovoracaceae bacterium]|nr:SDR family oxidoreductase [Bacteriovoracaceae bacterium]